MLQVSSLFQLEVDSLGHPSKLSVSVASADGQRKQLARLVLWLGLS